MIPDPDGCSAKVKAPALPFLKAPRGRGAVYLIGPDEGLDSQMILHQLLHVGLSSDHRGELRSCRQTQRRLIGGARRSAGVRVPEEHVPRLERGDEGGDGRRQRDKMSY